MNYPHNVKPNVNQLNPRIVTLSPQQRQMVSELKASIKASLENLKNNQNIIKT